MKLSEYEWLYDGNLDLDCNTFNQNLTEWLIEYNFNRPHQSLDYLTPMEYIEGEDFSGLEVLQKYYLCGQPEQ